MNSLENSDIVNSVIEQIKKLDDCRMSLVAAFFNINDVLKNLCYFIVRVAEVRAASISNVSTSSIEFNVETHTISVNTGRRFGICSRSGGFKIFVAFFLPGRGTELGLGRNLGGTWSVVPGKGFEGKGFCNAVMGTCPGRAGTGGGGISALCLDEWPFPGRENVIDREVFSEAERERGTCLNKRPSCRC
jgi:hypothetical protein